MYDVKFFWVFLWALVACVAVLVAVATVLNFVL